MSWQTLVSSDWCHAVSSCLLQTLHWISMTSVCFSEWVFQIELYFSDFISGRVWMVYFLGNLWEFWWKENYIKKGVKWCFHNEKNCLWEYVWESNLYTNSCEKNTWWNLNFIFSHAIACSFSLCILSSSFFFFMTSALFDFSI